jgi:hypothetical protein
VIYERYRQSPRRARLRPPFEPSVSRRTRLDTHRTRLNLHVDLNTNQSTCRDFTERSDGLEPSTPPYHADLGRRAREAIGGDRTATVPSTVSGVLEPPTSTQRVAGSSVREASAPAQLRIRGTAGTDPAREKRRKTGRSTTDLKPEGSINGSIPTARWLWSKLT